MKKNCKQKECYQNSKYINHSDWHFSYICKVVGEPKKQNLISAKKFVKRTGCLQPSNSLVQGFFHGCGFNSGGMMLGAGAGKELANWIVDGRPEFDLYG